MKRVFVLGHDAHFGAPRVLLDACKELSGRFSFEFAFLGGGAYLGEFEMLGKTSVLKKPVFTFRAIRTSLASLAAWAPLALRLFFRRPDVFYVNTVVPSGYLRFLKNYGRSIVIHVHELKKTIHEHVRGDDMAAFRSIPARYIACSRAVGECLTGDFGVDAARVSVVHAFIDTRRIDAARFSVSTGKVFTVGGAGWVCHRKGPDLWLDIAAAVKRKRPHAGIRFVWTGTLPEGGYARSTLEMRDRLGLRDDAVFGGATMDPFPVYAENDILLLTSREDPFPLVCLEHLYLEKPVICFAGAGGAPEAVEGDAGIVVPLDVEAAADAVVKLYEDASGRACMGRAGREKVRARFDARHGSALIGQILAEEAA